MGKGCSFDVIVMVIFVIGRNSMVCTNHTDAPSLLTGHPLVKKLRGNEEEGR
jgi:hypothetical protein